MISYSIKYLTKLTKLHEHILKLNLSKEIVIGLINGHKMISKYLTGFSDSVKCYCYSCPQFIFVVKGILIDLCPTPHIII